MNVFVAWFAGSVRIEMQYRTNADNTEGLRQLQQRVDHSNEVWRSWCAANDGSVLSVGDGEGTLQIPASKLKELPALQKQFGAGVSSDVVIGVGTKLSEAKRAMEAAKIRGSESILFYGPLVEEILEDDKEKDPIAAIANNGAEMKKALGQNGGAGAGFGGFSRGQGAAAPAPAQVETSEHSQGEALRGTIADAAENAPPAPEMTHAASDFDDQLHNLAAEQDQKDSAGAQDAEKSKAAIKSSIVAILQRIRGQGAIISQLKGASPDAYNAIMALVQGVIAMAHALDEKPSDGLQKSQKFKPAFRNGDTGEVVTGGANHGTVDVPESWEKPVDGFVNDDGEFFTREEALENLQKASKVLEKWHLAKGKLPMPSAPIRREITLPVGSVKEGGPDGNAHGEVGKVKVQHGDGKTSWIQARAGQVTAVADRHASPVVGTASHPLSSRNPTGH